MDGADLEDIQHDILVKIISKLDLILARPASQMVGYCYSIVNTALIDIYRAYHPEDVAGFVSLYEPVKGTSVDQDDASEIINFIADENTPEDEVIARENVSAIISARRQTQKEELLKKRKEILQEVDILSEKPDEALEVDTHGMDASLHHNKIALGQGLQLIGRKERPFHHLQRFGRIVLAPGNRAGHDRAASKCL